MHRDINRRGFVLAALLLAIRVINSFNFLPLMLPVAQQVYALDDEQISRLANWGCSPPALPRCRSRCSCCAA